MTTPFIPGLQLARQFHAELVGPLLDQSFPGIPYSAALIGWGSDVLGFDSPRSTDHNWGPRLQVFLAPGDSGLVPEITELLAGRLPDTFRGWPTAFPDATAASAEPRHWVEVTELGSWLNDQLGFDPRRGVILLDWIATPAQRLAEVTAGAVFHDGVEAASGPARGQGLEPGHRAGTGTGHAAEHGTGHGRGPEGAHGGLGTVRSRLAWYPRDIWLYVLGCQWQRIGQQEAFPGRCAEAGDELGSALVTARLARDLMRLCLLMQRRYPPYSKWLGTAFAALPSAAALGPVLAAAIAATGWPEREQQLSTAYEIVAGLHNELGITTPLETSTRPYYTRPFQVIEAGRFTAALRREIADPVIARLPPAGTVDQFIDNTDAFNDMAWLRTIVAARLAES
jgi:Domain of unknown function (DUF4037)